MPQAVIDGHQETLDGGAESARRILKAGGRLGMGGDYGFAWNPHGDYAKELTFSNTSTRLALEQGTYCCLVWPPCSSKHIDDRERHGDRNTRKDAE